MEEHKRTKSVHGTSGGRGKCHLVLVKFSKIRVVLSNRILYQSKTEREDGKNGDTEKNLEE